MLPCHDALLLQGGTVIDGTGGPPIRNAGVLIQGARIRRVGPAESFCQDHVEVVDTAECTLLPGLINMHAHLCMSGARGSQGSHVHEPHEVQLLRALRSAQISLASGVTTIRDLGGTRNLTQVVRDAIAQDVANGPRIVSSGQIITTTAGHGWKTGLRADTADELKRAARASVEGGVDVLKVAASGGGGTPGSNVAAPQYSEDELRVFVEEARRLGKRVAAHAIGTASIRNAVAAGVDTIEHCGWMGPAGELDVDEVTIDRMRDQGTTVVPTCTVWYRSAYDNPDGMSDDRKKMRAVRDQRTAAWARMHAAGVRFAAGPDTGIHDTYWNNFAWELELMLEKMGVSAMDAILAATRNGAIGLGLEQEIGTVEPGKIADLILVDGDPLADLGALRRVRRVYRAGRLVVADGTLTMQAGPLTSVCGQPK